MAMVFWGFVVPDQTNPTSFVSENCSPLQTISEDFASEVGSFYNGRLSNSGIFPVIARLLHEVVLKSDYSSSDASVS